MCFLYFQSSPPPMSPKGRTQDVDAIVSVINKAEKFVHISVMDYFPLTLYTPKPKYVKTEICKFIIHMNSTTIPQTVFSSPCKCSLFRFWPIIDDALRAAAIDRQVSVKLLISYWNHSRPAEDYFLKSLQDIAGSYPGVDVQVVRKSICSM